MATTHETRQAATGLSLETLARACLSAALDRPDRITAVDVSLVWLSRRHRLEGLFAAAVRDRLGVEAAVAESLATLAQCRDLADAMGDLDALFLKGLAVAGQGFANPLLKRSADIDLLIDLSSLGRAADRLHQLGFTLVFPTRPGALAAWHRCSNQSVWKRGTTVVELHHRPLPYNLLESLQRHGTRQQVEIAGVKLTTFAPLDNFAYLTAHGALSGWFRLKWLVDLAALVERTDVDPIDAYRHAKALGVGRTAAAALRLCERLFAMPIPTGEPALDRPEWRVRRMVELALGLLRGGEPTDTRFGTLPIHETALWATGWQSLRRWRDLARQRVST